MATWTKIPLNTTAGGANVASNQVNFPMGVHLNNNAELNAFWAEVSSVNHLRFYDSDKVTALKYEVESYAEADTYCWVKVPQIDGNSSADYIWLKGDNTLTVNGSDKEAVWDANFKAVHHLNLDKAEGAFDDSTANNYDGTNNGSIDVAGQFDRARYFDGNDYIGCGIFSAGTFANNASVSFWVKCDATQTHGPIKLSLASDPDDWLDYGGDMYSTVFLSSRINFAHGMTVTEQNHIAITTEPGANGWKCYINGALKHSVTAVDDQSGLSDYSFELGRSRAGGELVGQIDESRVSNITRSADWIKLTYENLKAGQLLYTFEAEVLGHPTMLRHRRIPHMNYIGGF